MRLFDLSYYNHRDDTCNQNVRFNVSEKDPIEYVSSNLEIVDLDPRSNAININLNNLFINNNDNCNIIYELYNSYEVVSNIPIVVNRQKVDQHQLGNLVGISERPYPSVPVYSIDGLSYTCNNINYGITSVFAYWYRIEDSSTEFINDIVLPYIDNNWHLNVDIYHNNSNIRYIDNVYYDSRSDVVLGENIEYNRLGCNLDVSSVYIYSNMDDVVMCNLFQGYIDDKIFKATNRVFDLDTLAYNVDVNTGIVSIDTDYSGKVYDLVVRAWLDGYKEYKELDYVIRVNEPVYEGAAISLEDMNETSMTFETTGTFLNIDSNVDKFVSTLKDEIFSNVGVDRRYIEVIPNIIIDENGVEVIDDFEIVLKVNVLDETPPSEYIVSIKQELEDVDSGINTKIQEEIGDEIGITIDKDSTSVSVPVVLKYSTSLTLQYEDGLLDIHDSNTEPLEYEIYDGGPFNNVVITDNRYISIDAIGRGRDYSILIIGESGNLRIEYNIDVSELRGNSIKVDVNNHVIDQIVSYKELDLRYFYSTYGRSDTLEFNIFNKCNISDEEFNNVSVNNSTGILRVEGQIDGKEYTVGIVAYDPQIIFSSDLVDCNLEIDLKEVVPLENISQFDELSNLITESITCNLLEYYNIETCNYDIGSTIKFRYIYSLSDNECNIIVDGSNIHVGADVRDKFYNIDRSWILSGRCNSI